MEIRRAISSLCFRYRMPLYNRPRLPDKNSTILRKTAQ
jgi:hypothetical protein